ncbi:MAG: hypothetical protein HQL88_02455 [Magnetococcales bacterium]|nr:hypothetical protein [Magnetococcales bacterium]
MEPLSEQGASTTPLSPEERRARWLAVGRHLHPEQLAAFVSTPQARWVVITQAGGTADGVHLTAYLESQADLPYWAFALAKSYLDDVGEWPLFGMGSEQAISDWEEHGDPVRAVREILASVKPVWPDLEIVYIGEEKH